MSFTSLTVNLVRDDSGNIDENLSRDAFDSALMRHMAESETETATIGAAVSAVFDQYKGQAINMPGLVNFTLSHLNAQPENIMVLAKRVTQYIRDNAQGKDLSLKGSKDRIWERPNSTYFTSKGKGGGVCRRSDMSISSIEE